MCLHWLKSRTISIMVGIMTSVFLANIPICHGHSSKKTQTVTVIYWTGQKRQHLERVHSIPNVFAYCSCHYVGGSAALCHKLVARAAAERSQPKVVGTSLNLIIAMPRLWLIKSLKDGERDGEGRGRRRCRCSSHLQPTLPRKEYILLWPCRVARGKYNTHMRTKNKPRQSAAVTGAPCSYCISVFLLARWIIAGRSVRLANSVSFAFSSRTDP